MQQDDSFQRASSSASSGRTRAKAVVAEEVWSPLAKSGGSRSVGQLSALPDPDWGSELNSGNRSWREMSPARTHGPILYQGGALQPLAEPEQSFESLSSLSENDHTHYGGHVAAADLQSDMAHAASGAPGGLYGDQAVVGAVARLQDTEQKVESLMREVALLKASATTIGTIAEGGTGHQVHDAPGTSITHPLGATPWKSTGVDPETGTIQSTPTPNVWLTPSGAAISLSKTGMPLLQSGMPTTEEGTQFPEPTPRTITPDPEVLEAQRLEEERIETEQKKAEEKKTRPIRKKALTTTAWISFADDDPEDRFDYCGEMVSSDRHGFGVLTWKDGSSYSGQFVQNKFHGYAFERYADGSVYVGQFCDDLRHGLGQFTQASGNSYSGQWQKGKQHGVGIEVQVKTDSAGGTVKGEFVCVYREGERLETYARTDKNSKRVGADLEIVFTKTSAVVNQVKAVTSRVRQMASGDSEEKENGDEKRAGGVDEHAAAEAAKEAPVDPATLAAARQAQEQLEREKLKLAEEMGAMKALLAHIDGQQESSAVAVKNSDPWLDDENMFKNSENFEHVLAKPFSYIPGLEDIELSTTVAKKGSALPPNYRRLDNLTADDHSQYKGALKGGRPHGHGTFIDASNGDSYEGEWLDGLYHGKGRLVKRNGIVYDGDFKEGLKHGHGVLHWPSNPSAVPRYEGSFKEDRKHGDGIEGGGGNRSPPRKVKYDNGCLVVDSTPSKHKSRRSRKQGQLPEIQIDSASARDARKELSRTIANRRKVKTISGDNLAPLDSQVIAQDHSDAHKTVIPSPPPQVHSAPPPPSPPSGQHPHEDQAAPPPPPESVDTTAVDFFNREFKSEGRTQAEINHTAMEGMLDEYEENGEGEITVRRIRGNDGSEFIGETLNGQWHGSGCVMFHEADTQGRVEYAGQFRAGQRHGLGSMLWKDGTNYMGEWKRNRPSGFGFEAYPNGSYYQGTFENDLRDGIGVYEFPDGLYYSGGWRRGKRYGSGIATDMHKSKFVLTYDRNGKLLSKHQFSSHAGADSFSADTAEREVVAEVLRVTLKVRKAAEAARKIASKELRSKGGVMDGAFKHDLSKGVDEREARSTKLHGTKLGASGDEAVALLRTKPASAPREAGEEDKDVEAERETRGMPLAMSRDQVLAKGSGKLASGAE